MLNPQNTRHYHGLFVAVGNSPDGSTILTFPDGVDWTQQIPLTGSLLWGVTYGNNTFVAVSIFGSILTSP
jgi:hypothetical protein